MARASALLLLLGSGSAACAGDLPISERIASGVFGPEPADLPARAEALPILDQIQVSPFIVDEQGPLTPERIEAELEPLWLACPMQPFQGLFACLSGQFPLVLDEIEDCPPVDLSAFDPESTEPPSIPVPCRITTDTPAAPSMQVPLDFNFLLGGDLELTMIAHRPEAGTTTNECAAYLLGDKPPSGDCLYLTQRAAIGPVGELIALAGDNGIEGLDLLGDQPDPVPDPDRNTRIESFEVIVSDEEVTSKQFEDLFRDAGDEAIEVTPGDTLTVKAGQTLVIRTIAPDLDLQFYPIPASPDQSSEPDPNKDDSCCARWYELNDKQPGGTSEDPTYPECPMTATDPADPVEGDYVIHLHFGEAFGCRVESYVGDWYRTWGTLLSNDSDDPVSYNTWTMVPGEQDDIESDLPPDGIATLYYVLRDDRQGVSWSWFHVMVTP